jgi:hypothetical protein
MSMPRKSSLFLQDTIAVIWDFDETLISGHMQTPLFRRFGIDEEQFWTEVGAMEEFHRENGVELVSETLYLNHLLTYWRHGHVPELTRELLRELGSRLEFYPGVPDIFRSLKELVRSDRFTRHNIELEHYVISSGLRQMILGSAVANYLEDVWACEFVEEVPLPGYCETTTRSDMAERFFDIGYTIDNTSKTRAVFEINKGTNKVAGIEVNAAIDHEQRRVPFQNMIYVADGPSDVPVFSVVKHYGGHTFAVYEPGSRKAFLRAKSLLDQGRVDDCGEADYTTGKHAEMWLMATAEQIAGRIATSRDDAVTSTVGLPPRHMIADSGPEHSLATASSADESWRPSVPRAATPDLVRDLLERLSIAAPPVDLRPILESLNIEVRERAEQKEDAVVVAMDPPEALSRGSWMVYLNPARPEVRKRYTVAHEVGHVLLHGASHGAARARSGGGSRMKSFEREADEFAAELLMPRDFLARAVADCGADVERLRRLFKVSKSAMQIRLAELGLDSAPSQTQLSA